MAVSLPSDLILDVMRNAEPARLQTAKAKLEGLQEPQGSGAAFAALLGRMDGEAVAATRGHDLPGLRNEPSAVPRHARAETDDKAYVDFERMVLRNLFESLLPQAQSGAFGTGPSAGVWRSMAADQLASIYADTGGIGIARTLAVDEARNGGPEEAQWPYFSRGPIQAFTG